MGGANTTATTGRTLEWSVKVGAALFLASSFRKGTLILKVIDIIDDRADHA